MNDRFERVSALRNSTEGINSKAWLALVALATFGMYLLVVIGGTTDEQFVMDKPILLPILNANVGIVGFYLLSPVLLLVLHGYFLSSAAILRSRVTLLDELIDGVSAPRSDRDFQRMIGPSGPLIEIVRPRSRWPRFLAQALLLGLVVITPLFLLLAIQARFLPYHSATVTWSHRLTVFVDIVLVTIFLLALVRRHRFLLAISFVLLIAVPVLLFSVFVVTIPQELTEEIVLKFASSSAIVPVSCTRFRRHPLKLIQPASRTP